MVYIYVLLLEQGKYYVGKTTNPEFRLEKHFNCGGSEWTIKYKPIKVLEIIKDCDDYDEDKYTRIYMDKFGIENVRGGSFCQIVLPKETVAVLEKMKMTSQDKCYKCGQKGHLAKYCTQKEEIQLPDDVDGLIEFSENFIQKLKDKEKMVIPTKEELLDIEYLREAIGKSNSIIECPLSNVKTITNAKIELQRYNMLQKIIHKPFDHCNIDITIDAIKRSESLRTKIQKRKNEEIVPFMEAILKLVKIL